VVLLHGFIFNLEPAWVAGGLFDTLAERNRVAALDLRGHGKSGKPHDAGRYGLEMVDDVLRLMAVLETERAHVIGYSLGAILASKLLEVAPERLWSLVLGGAGAVRAGDQVHRSWLPLATSLESIRPGTPLSSHFWPNQRERPPREVQQLVDDNDPAALAAVARGMVDVTVDDDVLRSNRVPILAICGEHDPARSSVTAMSSVTSRFAMHLVPGLDHHTLPSSEEFSAAIRSFIANPAAVQ
jgi:pimeloyl-ACP methyl ester carboxylesterase